MELAHKLVSSRSGTIVLAALAALLAAVLVLAYVDRYRARVDAGAAPVTVLVAKTALPKGTSGDVILSRGLFTTQRLRHDEAADGAVVDPTALRGRVATQDVYAGQQLTTAEFGASTGALSTKLTGGERAVSVPLDKAHGLIGQVEAGDHVDVLVGLNLTNLGGGAGRPLVKVALQDVPVLSVSKSSDAVASSGSNVVLRVTDEQAAMLAFSVENGKLWLVLRPRTGAARTPASLVTLESLLGLRALPVQAR